MTEAEWLACDDPEKLYFWTTDRRESRRKGRLLGCACARRLWHLLDPIYQEAVELAEQYEEGTATAAELSAIADAVGESMFTDYRGQTEIELARIVVQVNLDSQVAFPDLDKAASAFAWADENERLSWEQARASEIAVQIGLLRDIFGNLFRPVALKPTWLTSDVLALARGIYDERAFERMPILADALQDAGCDSNELLTHCRSPHATHVRGCWAVDLLLGKS